MTASHIKREAVSGAITSSLASSPRLVASGVAGCQINVGHDHGALTMQLLVYGEVTRRQLDEGIRTALVEGPVQTGVGVLGHVFRQSLDRLDDDLAVDIGQEARELDPTHDPAPPDGKEACPVPALGLL